MSNEPLDAESQKAIRDFKRILRRKSQEERERILQEARAEALNEELDEERERSELIAERLREDLTYNSPRKEALEARRTSPRSILLLLMLLLVLLLIATATGRSGIIRFPGSSAPANPEPTFGPRLPGSGQGSSQLAGAGGARANPAEIAALGSLSGPAPKISSRFRTYYEQHGGVQMFGLPISPELTVNGRTFQWFERARLEEWPENQDTPYAIQGGRVGSEFTKGIVFPKQTFFVSRPGIRYFGETGHGVRTPFLEFWEQNGGLDLLGYPIGDEVQERLPQDGQIHTVQYFERARIEYHPEHAGEPSEIQLGLLGRALYLENSKPQIITPVRPTPVPLP
jgi:hypothetical protein